MKVNCINKNNIRKILSLTLVILSISTQFYLNKSFVHFEIQLDAGNNLMFLDLLTIVEIWLVKKYYVNFGYDKNNFNIAVLISSVIQLIIFQNLLITIFVIVTLVYINKIKHLPQFTLFIIIMAYAGYVYNNFIDDYIYIPALIIFYFFIIVAQEKKLSFKEIFIILVSLMLNSLFILNDRILNVSFLLILIPVFAIFMIIAYWSIKIGYFIFKKLFIFKLIVNIISILVLILVLLIQFTYCIHTLAILDSSISNFIFISLKLILLITNIFIIISIINILIGKQLYILIRELVIKIVKKSQNLYLSYEKITANLFALSLPVKIWISRLGYLITRTVILLMRDVWFKIY